MICNTCGAQNPDGGKFCTSCGSPLPMPEQPAYPQQPTYQPQQPVYPQQTMYQPQQQPTYQPQQQQMYQPQQTMYQPQQPVGTPLQPELPMKWYKFLCVVLWIGALLNFVQGTEFLAGEYYKLQQGVDDELVYSVFPTMKPVDIFFGVFLVAFAVLGVVTALCLIKHKRIGPVLLIVSYAANAVFSLGYNIFGFVVLKDSGFVNNSTTILSSAFVSFVITGLIVYANYVYFKKRAHLFTN